MNYKRWTVILILLILCIFSEVSIVHAEVQHFRDGTIVMDLPDGCSVEEVEKTDKDERALEQVFHAKKLYNQNSINIDLYYWTKSADNIDLLYATTKDGALYYYNNTGKGLVEEYYMQNETKNLVSLNEPEYDEWSYSEGLRVSANYEDISSGSESEELI